MPNRKAKAVQAKAVFAAVVEDTAKPRVASSVRTFPRVCSLNPKFCEGEWVYNCITKEDGQVMRSYKEKGVCRYEVFVSAAPDSWLEGYKSSNWAENRLELSSNQHMN